jgi:hydroxyacid-oxoacid transhydrogenase
VKLQVIHLNFNDTLLNLFLGVSIFDLPEKECKTGIRLRAIKPLLAIVDPLNVMSMPRNVTIYSGFDVLCHALESYTAKPYNEVSLLLEYTFY